MLILYTVSAHNIQYMSPITQDGMSALHLAVVMGRTDVVVELVKNGANLNLQDEVCHGIYTIMYNYM